MIGVLLAAGKGRRFDPSGKRNKLLQPMAEGLPVAAVAAQTLMAATGSVLAVVSPKEGELARILCDIGCRTIVCPDAELGMGVSLVCGLRAAPSTDGFLIALADMPYLRLGTLTALVDAIAQGADIALPTYDGQRGNPVAFSTWHLPHLLRLGGDEGARKLLRQYPVKEVEVSDLGIFRDIDYPEDLAP